MHTCWVILNVCVINGLRTKCIESVVRLYANVNCNLLNIIPYVGSLGAGCLTSKSSFEKLYFVTSKKIYASKVTM